MTKEPKAWQERWKTLVDDLMGFTFSEEEENFTGDTLLRTDDFGFPEQYVESVFELDPEKVKAFITQEIADAEERGRREVIAELERQVEDGGSAEVILAAVKRNFPTTNTDGDGV